MWSYGFSDVVFNMTVNSGKNKQGEIVQIDFNEITFDKKDVIRHIERKYWAQNFSFKELPEKYKDLFLKKMNAGINQETLNNFWQKRGKE
jgi:hypothetical protein